MVNVEQPLILVHSVEPLWRQNLLWIVGGMNREYESFVYVWHNSKTGYQYFGRHSGQTDDGYVFSSQNPYFWLSFIHEYQYWTRYVLVHGTKQQCTAIEKALINYAYEHDMKVFNICGPTTIEINAERQRIKRIVDEFYA